MRQLLIFILFFIGALLLSQCAVTNVDDCVTYDFSDCNTKEPLTATLNVKVTVNAENKRIPITVYRGKIEENLIVLTDTLVSSTQSLTLPVGYYYSVRAEYHVSGKGIYAIDGDDIIKRKKYVCDSVCWSVKNGDADLRLK